MDYANWVMSESKGSVKLNKIARRILSTYIPFRAEICASLMPNNNFAEHIQAYELKKKQQLHRLRKLIQKFQEVIKFQRLLMNIQIL